MNDESTAPVAPLVYAVWIDGVGWLKKDADNRDTTFVAFRREVAESAARLWGANARVLPFDHSLLDLESNFLAHQAERKQVGVKRILNGILG